MDIFEQHRLPRLFSVYERPGVAGLHRDFYDNSVGYGTLSEHLAPYDEESQKESVAYFAVKIVSQSPPLEVRVESLPSPHDLAVVVDPELSTDIILEGIIKAKNMQNV